MASDSGDTSTERGHHGRRRRPGRRRGKRGGHDTRGVQDNPRFGRGVAGRLTGASKFRKFVVGESSRFRINPRRQRGVPKTMAVRWSSPEDEVAREIRNTSGPGEPEVVPDSAEETKVDDTDAHDLEAPAAETRRQEDGWGETAEVELDNGFPPPASEGKELAADAAQESGEKEEPGEALDPMMFGHYQAVKPLGECRLGRIYEGWDSEEGEAVFLVLLKPEGMLLAEEPVGGKTAAAAEGPVESTVDSTISLLDALGELSHDHVQAIRDWSLEHPPFLVYPSEGVSLRRIIDAEIRLSPSQVLLIGLQVAETLEGLRFPHGDLRPETLTVDAFVRLRLLGVGTADLLLQNWGNPHAVDRYAAPELLTQGSGLGPLDQASADIYSLALLLAEAAVGSYVPPHLLRRSEGSLLTPDYDDPVRLLGPLAPIFMQAVQSDPAARPSVGEFILALRSTAEMMTPPERFDSILVAIEEPRQPSEEELPEGEDEGSETGRRTSVITAVAASLAVVVCAGLLLLGVGRTDETPSHEVPAVVGMSWDEADATLRSFGWLPRRLDVRTEGSTYSEVVGQMPDAASLLDEGQVVKVQVSLGGPLVVVPLDLLGIPLPEARLRLSEIGLQLGEVESRPESGLEPDIVVAIDEQSPELPRGSEVDLVISAPG